MEFKGSKKIEIKKGEYSFTADNEGYGVVAQFIKEEDAIIFKHSSEMLDFINRLSGEMLRNDFVLDEKWHDQAQELIKQATTI